MKERCKTKTKKRQNHHQSVCLAPVQERWCGLFHICAQGPVVSSSAMVIKMEKKTLQISWHLQTLASASLFTSRLSRNVTAVFPFFFFSVECNHQTSLLFTDIQCYYVYYHLPVGDALTTV